MDIYPAPILSSLVLSALTLALSDIASPEEQTQEAALEAVTWRSGVA